MKISFLSFDQDQQKTAYQTSVRLEDNVYIFEDKTYKNTTIQLQINSDEVILNRKGDCRMHMQFVLDKLTLGFYQNIEGVEFDFFIKTKHLQIENKRIRIRYSMFIGEEEVSSSSIQFTFFES